MKRKPHTDLTPDEQNKLLSGMVEYSAKSVMETFKRYHCAHADCDVCQKSILALAAHFAAALAAEVGVDLELSFHEVQHTRVPRPAPDGGLN